MNGGTLLHDEVCLRWLLSIAVGVFEFGDVLHA